MGAGRLVNAACFFYIRHSAIVYNNLEGELILTENKKMSN